MYKIIKKHLKAAHKEIKERNAVKTFTIIGILIVLIALAAKNLWVLALIVLALAGNFFFFSTHKNKKPHFFLQ